MAGQVIELRGLPGDIQACKEFALEVFGTSYSADLQPYFRYYSRQCKQVTTSILMAESEFPLKTHSDILSVARMIRSRSSHSHIKASVAANNPQSPAAASGLLLNNCIDLAARLLLMIDVGIFQNVYTGRGSLDWTAGTIDEFVATLPFLNGTRSIPVGGVKLESQFNALNLERIAGFEVQLTTNLADHLLLKPDLKVVTIFHHATFLQHCKGPSSVFPDLFVDETLQTMAIMFPKGSRDLSKWYQRKAQADDLDYAALKCNHNMRRLEEFVFWRDRLVQLKEAYDDSRPRSIRQWWYDRREGAQWYALWVAVFFTVFFGLVQSIEGALQVYKAYHPSD